MIKRRAIIIGNPGEIGAVNYCDGVNKDLQNYKSFLTSPLGGLWYDNEIEVLLKPNLKKTREALGKLKDYDYTKVIFSGHGEYSSSVKSTILELNKVETIDLNELRKGSPRQTIIVDCCRKIAKSVLVKSFQERMIKLSDHVTNKQSCRMYYDKCIEECTEALLVLYSCNIDEVSNDDSARGGYYSFSLIDSAEEWENNDSTDTSKFYNIFSLPVAHEKASIKTKRLSGDRQNPQIEKPKEEKYFPFAVIA
ncbi:MAG: caspase family protein [Ignavibacteriales bacterium]|nr:caspase family protein [Ignavibacteriales bacterium]